MKQIKLLAIIWLAFSQVIFLEGKTKVTDLKLKDAPPAAGINSYYTGNRPPLKPNPLIKLPVGQIEVRGWLLSQLQLMRSGFTGHLAEISKFLQEDSGWLTRRGRGWEEMPYWLKGYGDLAYLLRDAQMIAEARKWIEAILASQQEDGYFGPVDNRQANDLWPNMEALICLQSYYDYSHDRRVLDFMSKYFRYELKIPEEQFLPGSWQKLRGGENLDSVYWLYNRTGEKWLLDLASKIYRQTADWASPILTAERDRRWEESSFYHGVNIAMGLKYPALYYQQTGERQLLEAVERNYQQLMAAYGQQPGGMFAADENIRPGYNDPRQGAETCTMVELMSTFENLLRITGEVRSADRIEEIAFNSLPASMTPDLKGLHYLTAANLIADDKSGEHDFQNSGTLLSYDPWSYRCCQHNVAFGWPYFSEHLWLATSDNGVAALLYAPSTVEVKAGQQGTMVRIVEETSYPFSGKISLTVFPESEVEFPLYLRLPGWAEKASIAVNEEKAAEVKAPGKLAVLERRWKYGDQVSLFLDESIRVKFWPGIGQAASVSRGPLWFSLEIKEIWKSYGGTETWPAYEVWPGSDWNYALILDQDNLAENIRLVEKKEISYQPFSLENTPIILEAKARQLPEWQAQGQMAGRVPASPVSSNSARPEEIVRLVPMGCARLRITCFPWFEKRK
jgi:hypothetical protein